MYLELGLEDVVSFLEKVVFPKVETGAFSHAMDYKIHLQELIQQGNNGTLTYEIVEESGPAHNRTFVSRVLFDGQQLGTGNGKSNKEAEQHAVQTAIIMVKQHNSREEVDCF